MEFVFKERGSWPVLSFDFLWVRGLSGGGLREAQEEEKKNGFLRGLSAVFWPVQGEEENSKGEGLRGSLPTALGTPKKFKKSPLPCIARDEKK